ncbi:cell death regulator Aven [Petromyzon marinus]|uniref:Cell death regulator Aven n=1 Tax=Petromyzon marinus TaxID=7757 RepID=A0AAJ7WNF1_PETMA|nr:cell death regulator Aven [Petromyzon marinus]XP_032804186.1 cell death regulator Aven [Petromyzon marinus]
MRPDEYKQRRSVEYRRRQGGRPTGDAAPPAAVRGQRRGGGPHHPGRPWDPQDQGPGPHHPGRPWDPQGRGAGPQRPGRPWDPQDQGPGPHHTGRPWDPQGRGAGPQRPGRPWGPGQRGRTRAGAGRARGWRGGHSQQYGRDESAGFGANEEGADEDVCTRYEEEEQRRFSRRKIVSNWDRYGGGQEPAAGGGKEGPVLEEESQAPRGSDFSELLSSAGDAFAQFRFTDEREWEADSLERRQMDALSIDCEAIALALHGLPRHLRLNIEPEIILDVIPKDIGKVPTWSVPKLDFKQPTVHKPAFTAPSPATTTTTAAATTTTTTLIASKIVSPATTTNIHSRETSGSGTDAHQTDSASLYLVTETKSRGPSTTKEPDGGGVGRSVLANVEVVPDVLDEELDFLLSLDKAAAPQPPSVPAEHSPESAPGGEKEPAGVASTAAGLNNLAGAESDLTDTAANDAGSGLGNDQAAEKMGAPPKEETESRVPTSTDDLEDWLDSMIA